MTYLRVSYVAPGIQQAREVLGSDDPYAGPVQPDSNFIHLLKKYL